MSIRRPFILVAASATLLGAAACSGGSPTGADSMSIANPPVRDTSGFIPVTPPVHR
jgi:hypothetical protein